MGIKFASQLISRSISNKLPLNIHQVTEPILQKRRHQKRRHQKRRHQKRRHLRKRHLKTMVKKVLHPLKETK